MIDPVSPFRLLGGACWLICFVTMLPSFWRAFRFRARPNDKIWGLVFLAAGYQLSYTLSWIFGRAYMSVDVADIVRLSGQHMFGSMLALSFVVQRRILEGQWW